MQDEEWANSTGQEGQEVVEELYLNVGGLVGAVANIEGTGQLITGTGNEEPELSSDAAGLGNRLTVHSIRDTQGRVLGLGPQRGIAGGGGGGGGGDDDEEVAGGWEPVIEAWASHEGTVTGVDVVGGGYGSFGGGRAGVLTSGGDGCLRMFELTPGDRADGGESPAPGPSLALQGKVNAHAARATGVAATARRAVTVDEDGVTIVVDLQRLGGGGGGGGGGGRGRGGGAGGGDGDGAGCVVWKAHAKGAMPLSGVTFQGESEEVFATVGCDPRGQLMVWDARSKGNRPVHAALGCVRGSAAPYLCVSSQPFNPEVFACGVSTGELLLWDVRAREVVHELQEQNRGGSGGGGTWGVAFHPRRPRHLFSCTGSGVLTKWYLPPEGQAMPSSSGFGGGSFGGGGGAEGRGEESWVWRGLRDLHALPSRSALVGVCYDEGADTISAVSKHGHVVVAQGVQGLRL